MATRISEISAFLREQGCTSTESNSFCETSLNWRYESADFALIKFTPRTITLPRGFYHADGTVFYKRDENLHINTVTFQYENDSLLDIKAQILRAKKEYDDAKDLKDGYWKRVDFNAKKRAVESAASDWET